MFVAVETIHGKAFIDPMTVCAIDASEPRFGSDSSPDDERRVRSVVTTGGRIYVLDTPENMALLTGSWKEPA